MGRISRSWTKPRTPGASFPPYQLIDQDFVKAAEDKTRKLARIYHMGQEQSWDGRATLRDLVDKHGGIHIADDKRESLAKILSVLLWGELAAWSVSADIALLIDETDAKMAASSQVFDEARHFYVLRDYVWQAGLDIPRLGGYSHRLLRGLLETDNLLHKIVGMQLLVENTAVAMFKMVGKARIEPVLSDLFVLYERDEARHVGLGVLVLPDILTDLSRRESIELWAFQARLYALMVGSGMTMRKAFADIGLDQSELQLYGFRLQRQVMGQMRGTEARRANAERTKGLFRLNRSGQERLNRFLFPRKPEPELHPLHLPALRALVRAVTTGDRWLAPRM